jgi:hypothetical protein
MSYFFIIRWHINGGCYHGADRPMLRGATRQIVIEAMDKAQNMNIFGSKDAFDPLLILRCCLRGNQQCKPVHTLKPLRPEIHISNTRIEKLLNLEINRE